MLIFADFQKVDSRREGLSTKTHVGRKLTCFNEDQRVQKRYITATRIRRLNHNTTSHHHGVHHGAVLDKLRFTNENFR